MLPWEQIGKNMGNRCGNRCHDTLRQIEEDETAIPVLCEVKKTQKAWNTGSDPSIGVKIRRADPMEIQPAIHHKGGADGKTNNQDAPCFTKPKFDYGGHDGIE